MSGHCFERLKSGILDLSHSQDWSIAKMEWDVINIEHCDHGDSCLCGKDIHQLCYLNNRITYNTTIVGNVCVTNFFGYSYGALFHSLYKIADSMCEASASERLLDDAIKKRIITQDDYSFYLDIRLKRNLSDKQNRYKKDINVKIGFGYCRNEPRNKGSIE